MVSEIKKKKLADLQEISLKLESFSDIVGRYRIILVEVNDLNIKKNSYNFFSKKFNKKYKEIVSRCEELEVELNLISVEKEKIEKELLQLINEHIELFDNISIPSNLEYQYNKLFSLFESAKGVIVAKKTIKDFNMSFEEAVKFLNDNGLPVILEKEDKNIIDNSISFDDLNNFVLVHKTNYLPSNNHISTSQESNAKISKIILDRVGSVDYVAARNTVHFSVNGEVSSHVYGNWESCKYAIVVPFPEMPISQLRSGAVMDTFFEGGIDLPANSILLCPVEEVEKAKNYNSNLVVLGYEDYNVTGYADALVGMLGKKVEEIGMWSWSNEKDAFNYYASFQDVMPNILAHSDTFESSREKILTVVNHLLAIVDKSVEKNLILTDDEKVILIENLQIFRMDNLHFLEQNKQLFNEIVLIINDCLSKYGILLSEDKIEKIRELNFTNVEISDDEISEYNKMTMKQCNYCDKDKYMNYLLVTDIFGQLNKYNQNTHDNITKNTLSHEKLADQIVENMANDVLDVNGQPILENYYDGYTRNKGFTGIQLLGLVAGISSIIIALVGILFLFSTR